MIQIISIWWSVRYLNTDQASPSGSFFMKEPFSAYTDDTVDTVVFPAGGRLMVPMTARLSANCMDSSGTVVVYPVSPGRILGRALFVRRVRRECTSFEVSCMAASTMIMVGTIAWNNETCEDGSKARWWRSYRELGDRVVDNVEGVRIKEVQCDLANERNRVHHS